MKMDRLLGILDRTQSAVAFLNFAALTAIVSLQILSRFVTLHPMLWSEEIARFLFFWLVMNGTALAVNRDRHFVIEIIRLPEWKSGPAKLALELMPVACIFVTGLLMLYYGLDYAGVGGYRIMPISGVNMKWVYIAIPLSGALIATYSLCNGIRIIMSHRKA